MIRRRARRGGSARPAVDRLEGRVVPTGFLATGAGPGGAPVVRVFDAGGVEKASLLAFDEGFRGGLEVALGDVNGDGVPDIVAAAGRDRGVRVGPRVKVVDGRTGEQLAGPLGEFFAYTPRFRGGVSVATGDVDGDGHADIITGAGPGGPPRVKVFSGADGSVLASFLAFPASSRSGVRVAAGDFQGHGRADIATAAGPGGAPIVRVFDGDTGAALARFAAYGPGARGGVSIGAGDVDRDGIADVVTGQGPGGRPLVKVFSGATGRLMASYLAYDASFRGGVAVDVADADGDTFGDVFTAPGAGHAPVVKAFRGATPDPLQAFASAAASPGGLDVAGTARRDVGGEYCTYQYETNVLPEYPVLDRLAVFDSNSGLFVPVAAGSVSNSATTAKNVYVIAHGWMPGYLDWVQANQQPPPGNLPLSWQTWQDPNSGVDPSTPWLYQEIQTTDPVFDVTTTGLAQQILAVDPNATVLAYSWIDDSATCEDWAGIPEDVFHSEAYTMMNGLRMAEGLMQVLDTDYAQGLGKVHLLGHSHGSRVATVAALALQQAAAADPSFDVVRQLTILDSPEDNDADIDDNNPVDIDAANFNWFFLSQMQVARAVSMTGALTAGQPAVAVPDTTHLVVGMGVAGAGIPSGATVASVDPSNSRVTLSVAATATVSSSLTFTPPAGSMFVDNYISYYDAPYGNFVVDAPAFGIHDRALTNVVDVGLNPLPFSSFDSNVISLEHEYAAAWYAGSQYTAGMSSGDRVGLFWSPLLPNAPINLPAYSTQTWTDSNLGPTTQFLLAPSTLPAAVQPSFTPLTLQQTGVTPGVTPSGPPAAVTSVQLTDAPGNAAFSGTFSKTDDSVVGFAFDYDFSQAGDGAQLQVWLNGALYFAMTGDVARALPNSGKLSATFGLGYEYSGTQNIQIILTKPSGSTGPATTVTVDNFHTFTL